MADTDGTDNDGVIDAATAAATAADKDAAGGDSSGDDDDDAPFDAERAQRKINRTNREAAGLRARLKEAEDIVKLYNKEQESKLSEKDLATKRAEAAEKKAQTLQDMLDRQTVKHDYELTDAQAKRLVGSTLDELIADAKELLEAFPVKGKKDAAPKAGTPDPKEVFADGKDDDKSLNPTKLAAAIKRR